MAKNYAKTYLIGLCSHVECVAAVSLSRLFTASLFTHAREKAREASAKHAGVGAWGVWAKPLHSKVLRVSLASNSLAVLFARSAIE